MIGSPLQNIYESTRGESWDSVNTSKSNHVIIKVTVFQCIVDWDMDTDRDKLSILK